jgi:benzoate-CoA ligase
MEERPTPSAVINRLLGKTFGLRPTLFGGVPTLFASLIHEPGLPASGEHSLRACISAGEALPEEVGKRWKARTGVDILDGIGSTEMLHIYLSNRHGDVRYGTTGRPVSGYEIELRRDDGSPAAKGEIGDLWVKGPSAASMYWNNRERSLATFVGPWIKSGDRYLERDDGAMVYQGRSDDMLKVGGIYVSPFEVEACLIEHESVLEAAVVGHADEEGLIKPRAYVVLKAGVSASQSLSDALKQHVKTRLAPYKYPRWIEFIAELPKTATGKIQRFKLR